MATTVDRFPTAVTVRDMHGTAPKQPRGRRPLIGGKVGPLDGESTSGRSRPSTSTATGDREDIFILYMYFIIHYII